MKIPKIQPVSVMSSKELNDFPYPPMAEHYDYSHNNRRAGEIAGHIFNNYLEIVIEDAPSRMKKVRYILKPTNPHKARVGLLVHLPDAEMMSSVNSQVVLDKLHENSVHELIGKALNAVDIVHNLENSWLKRLKYLFTKKI